MTDKATAIFRRALEEIAKRGPETRPDAEDYDDTESAYGNGLDVGQYELAEIARTALAAAGSTP